MSSRCRGVGPACTCGRKVSHGDGVHGDACERFRWLRNERDELLAELRSCPPDRAVTLLQAFDVVADELARPPRRA